jgi:hypothetical protein
MNSHHTNTFGEFVYHSDPYDCSAKMHTLSKSPNVTDKPFYSAVKKSPQKEYVTDSQVEPSAKERIQLVNERKKLLMTKRGFCSASKPRNAFSSPPVKADRYEQPTSERLEQRRQYLEKCMETTGFRPSGSAEKPSHIEFAERGYLAKGDVYETTAAERMQQVKARQALDIAGGKVAVYKAKSPYFSSLQRMDDPYEASSPLPTSRSDPVRTPRKGKVPRSFVSTASPNRAFSKFSYVVTAYDEEAAERIKRVEEEKAQCVSPEAFRSGGSGRRSTLSHTFIG